jgi:GDP-D-mannose 3', 5'-epimerase
MLDRDGKVLVTGAGGFIGGHLVRFLHDSGFARIRAVDAKPLTQWHQVHPRAENRQLVLGTQTAAAEAVAGCSYVVNLAADMGGMGFIARHKACCMLSVLINTTLLMAARDHGVSRYFFSSSACVYRGDLQSVADVTGLR